MAPFHPSFLALALLVLPVAAGSAPEDPPMPFPPHLARGRIGVQVQSMTPELREFMDAPKEAGILVVRVEQDSPAAEAGVRVGDVITRADGEPVESPHDLVFGVGRIGEGEKLALELVREGETLSVEVTPAGAPLPERGSFERWLPGGAHRGFEALERRLEQLERRLQELEGRLPPQKPT